VSSADRRSAGRGRRNVPVESWNRFQN
jgi:hypothetical protein